MGLRRRIVHPDDQSIYDRHVEEDENQHRNSEVEFRIIHTDGSIRWISHICQPVYADQEAYLGVRGSNRDVTKRKLAEERIYHMATHDGLTDLPTLKLAMDRLSMALSEARRHRTMAAVMFIDLDGFKAVNDTLGHDAGDYVLKQVTQSLLASVRETDTVARVGGDEFLIIATGVHSPENTALIAEKILQLMSQPVIFNGRKTVVGTSIGIALYPDHGKDKDQLIKLADEAMYRIKNSGKNGYSFANLVKPPHRSSQEGLQSTRLVDSMGGLGS